MNVPTNVTTNVTIPRFAVPRSGTPGAIVSVVLIRHAQSTWNAQNRFTGWANPPLTSSGVSEARDAGLCLQARGFHFDVAYSSVLQRAQLTRALILSAVEQPEIEQMDDWRLNERHYGALQGTDKIKAMASVGEQQVWRWRRSYLEQAEPLASDDPAHPRFDPLYAEVPAAQLPAVENLAQTRARVSNFWDEQITPRIKRSERILISAHGNTLRALIMQLSGMTVAEVESFEIPTASPIIVDFDQQANFVQWRYLCDESAWRHSA